MDASQMMVQRAENWMNGIGETNDILGSTVQSAIRATKQALYDLDHPLSPDSVKNPVVEKVQIADGIVLDSDGGMHGVGFINVKTVMGKYGGDFAVSCDSEKFRAVVML
jgi:hypothetical protein